MELFHKNSQWTQHIDYFCKKGSTADELQTRLQLLFHENCYLVVGLKQVVLRVWPNGNVAVTDDVNILISKIDCSLPGVGCIYHYYHASMILLWLHRVWLTTNVVLSWDYRRKREESIRQQKCFPRNWSFTVGYIK